MAIPALRLPKIVLEQQQNKGKPKPLPSDNKYVLLSLKSKKKLVVTADSYNGILSMGDIFKCVFCDTLLELDLATKDLHVRSMRHCQIVEKHPHIEEFSHNLVRKVNNISMYCTLCNVTVPKTQLMKHISTAAHVQELERAETRALTHKVY